MIVLTGAGRAFCAGGDVTGFKSAGTADFRARCSTSCRAPTTSAAARTTRAAPAYFPAIAKPIIAMLNGATAGLGLVHALFADMRFAADDAVLTTAFARLGLASEYGMAWALRNAVGHANALDLLLSARKVRGEEALRLGLVNQIHPREELAEATYAYARELAAACSPLSLRMIKRQLWELPFQTLHEALIADSADMIADQPQRGLRGRQARIQGKAQAALQGTMNLHESPEDAAFRAEVRDFVAAQLPEDIRQKVLGFLRVPREDYVRWQRILAEPRLGRARLAGRARRLRLERRAAQHLRRGMLHRRRAAPDALRPRDDRAGADEVRQRRAEGALPAAHRVDGRLVVPGLFGARRRLRPRLAEDPRRARRRALRRQRPEDLDLVRAMGQLDVRAGAHLGRRRSRSAASRCC